MESELALLREKLNWYAVNQDLIDKNDGLVQKQRIEITTLKEKISKIMLGEGGVTTKTHKNQLRQIKKLQETAKELEEALQKRNPDSIVSRSVSEVKGCYDMFVDLVYLWYTYVLYSPSRCFPLPLPLPGLSDPRSWYQ